jgi:dipicolinate synthase subunit A
MEGCPVLILGWGRIGKCLTKLLCSMGAEVTVAARKPSDRAMIEAFGCSAADICGLWYILGRYRVLFTTVPYPVLGPEQLEHCRQDCVKIELASTPGITGSGVIQAKGLPGTYAPESSGKLIARTILRILAQKEAGQ